MKRCVLTDRRKCPIAVRAPKQPSILEAFSKNRQSSDNTSMVFCQRHLLALLLSLSPLWLNACSLGIHGNFGWSSHDNRGIKEPERSLLIESEFRIGRENLYFYSHETIWWIYQITGGLYFDDEFLAALYENNNTPQPILVDLREARLYTGDCCDYIRYYYEGLKPGRYLLRIAYTSKAIDEVSFLVFPREGFVRQPASSQRIMSKNTQEAQEEKMDEILYYSRPIFSRDE